MQKFKINEDFIFRKNDNIIFDTQSFVVHKFNREGMDIMHILQKHPQSIYEVAEKLNYPQSDCQDFFSLAIKARILIPE